MDCPNCGTWNPDDKTQCWRCQKELPKPAPPKKKRAINPMTWVWVFAAVMILVLILQAFLAFQQAS
jgi:predicted amidophosphoribosyltransferase